MAKRDSDGNDTRRLRKLIKGVRGAMLVTAGSDGSLHGRPMQPVQGRFEGELWFFATAGSQAAAEVRDQGRVTVVFVDPGDDLYASVSGVASVVTDRGRIRDLWKPSLKKWFKQGKNDPELVLLRVVVESAEVWDDDSGAMARLTGFGGPSLPEPAQVENRNPVVEPGGTGAQG